MTETLKALIVGLVQGLTEFLPVSSSGHIVIAQEMLGLHYEESQNLLIAIVLHFATALSTMVIYRNQIFRIFRGLFQFQRNEEFLFSLKIILSMIPAALMGIFLKDTLEELFSNLELVGFMLLITSGLLFFADRAKNAKRDIHFKDALFIGIAQAVAALLPGISRSGTTISTSIILGNERSQAAQFSFLMVLPLIFGATAKMFIDAQSSGVLTMEQVSGSALLAGFIAAFFSGLIACKWMISLVKKAKLTWFAVYCLLVGLTVIGYSLFFKS